MQGYKDRDGTLGRKMGTYNVEELATLWHFPVEAVVKAPLVQKAPGRKSEPPISLPYGETKVDLSTFDDSENIFSEIDINLEKEKNKQENKNIISDEKMFEKEKTRKGEAPSNLPFV